MRRGSYPPSPVAGTRSPSSPSSRFLFADLHPHLMALPLGLFLLAWGLAVRTEVRKDARVAAALALGALALGAVRATNPWDGPLLTLVVVATGRGGIRRRGPEARDQARLGLAAACGLGPVLLSFVLFRPFGASYVAPYSDVQRYAGEATPLAAWLWLWGVPAFAVTGLVAFELARRLAETPASVLGEAAFWRDPVVVGFAAFSSRSPRGSPRRSCGPCRLAARCGRARGGRSARRGARPRAPGRPSPRRGGVPRHDRRRPICRRRRPDEHRLQALLPGLRAPRGGVGARSRVDRRGFARQRRAQVRRLARHGRAPPPRRRALSPDGDARAPRAALPARSAWRRLRSVPGAAAPPEALGAGAQGRPHGLDGTAFLRDAALCESGGSSRSAGTERRSRGSWPTRRARPRSSRRSCRSTAGVRASAARPGFPRSPAGAGTSAGTAPPCRGPS